MQIPRRRILVTLACLLCIAQSVLAAQSNLGLRIQITEGNGAQNNLEQIPATPITLRVIDRNNRPVPGVTVVFTAPESGPSGDFPSGLNSLTTITDEEGFAVAREYRPNEIQGAYEIQVRADFLGEIVNASIRQTNVAPKRGMGKVLVIMAVAGAAGGLALVARSGGGQPDNPADTATPPPSASLPRITFAGSSVGGTN